MTTERSSVTGAPVIATDAHPVLQRPASSCNRHARLHSVCVLSVRRSLLLTSCTVHCMFKTHSAIWTTGARMIGWRALPDSSAARRYSR